MASRFGFASLIPPGLEIDSVDSGENTLVVTARRDAATASCPLCGVVSHRVQSHYIRQPSDLPCAGRRVRLRILVRRFRCGVPGCLREVFAERFDTAVLPERARRTGRLEEIVHHLGLVLGGRPGDEGFLRREDTTRQILALKEAGHSIKEIVRRTRHSRKLVRQTVRGSRGDMFRVRQSSLEAYLPVLDAEWASGCRNGAELWRRLANQGFRGCRRVVSEWATRRRRADQMQIQGLNKTPSARTLARLMGMARDHLSKADTVIVAAVEAGVPGLVDARHLVDRFQAMIRTKAASQLDGWIEQARVSLIGPLARGVAKDVAAIRAAIIEPWSNGQTEGQITRLKLV